MTTNPGSLFVVSAPSGAGKTSLVTTVLNELSSAYPIERVITYTSRAPRQGEVDGKDYCFIPPQEFEVNIQNGFFIEWSAAYGTYYGSPRSILDGIRQGRSYIAILDRAGAQAVKAACPEAVLIWIYTQNLAVLRERLMARGQNTPEQITQRLGLAESELEEEAKNGLFFHHILNDDFALAVEKLKTTMLVYLNASSESNQLENRYGSGVSGVREYNVK